MTATTTPDAIPRDVRDMHRGQLEAEVVRLRADVELMLATARDNETTLQDVRDVLSRQRTMMHFAEREYLEMAANLTATQARCTELLLENRELKVRIERADNCGQQGVCAIAPGCSMHWAERVREEAANERSAIAAWVRALPHQLSWTDMVAEEIERGAHRAPAAARWSWDGRNESLKPGREQSVAGGIVESTREAK